MTTTAAVLGGRSFRGFLGVVFATGGDCGPAAAFRAAFLARFRAFLDLPPPTTCQTSLEGADGEGPGWDVGVGSGGNSAPDFFAALVEALAGALAWTLAGALAVPPLPYPYVVVVWGLAWVDDLWGCAGRATHAGLAQREAPDEMGYQAESNLDCREGHSKRPSVLEGVLEVRVGELGVHSHCLRAGNTRTSLVLPSPQQRNPTRSSS